MAKSDNLRAAKVAKNDEFYTQLDDIIAEIAQHPDYVRQFEGKTVFCNCDDPEWSNFVVFFRKFFKKLKLKKMISTHYNKDGSPSYKLEWSGEKINGNTVNMIKTPLEGNGDFRSPECIELLKEADIVVTNPPFSLFREYVDLLLKYEKQFIIVGNNNAITYKDFFEYLYNLRIWLGYSSNKTCIFRVADGYEYDQKLTAEINDGYHYGKVPAISWFTNFDIDKRYKDLPLSKNYIGNESKYSHYYNYDAIDVKKVFDIPKDYFGRMGVPITFLAEHCADQFEIIGLGTYVPKTKEHIAYKSKGIICYEVNGQAVWTTKYTVSERKIGNSLRIEKDGLPNRSPYGRIIIQRKKAITDGNDC